MELVVFRVSFFQKKNDIGNFNGFLSLDYRLTLTENKTKNIEKKYS